MLFISFNEAEITDQSTNIQNSVHQYNRRFSSQPRTVSFILISNAFSGSIFFPYIILSDPYDQSWSVVQFSFSSM